MYYRFIINIYVYKIIFLKFIICTHTYYFNITITIMYYYYYY